ncbi:YdeI/OmpD-associated family protein [Bdellovibrio sp. HCB-162]|uniref:YdeI/OmpD-associated family protein n=1 Tax=Bdellovibrio sp. HCB-162 TaxID=3394234 RepID=UPI0039BD7978
MGVRAKKKSSEKDILSFESAKQWLSWLRVNHARSSGVWLQIQKKGSAEKSPTYAEALDAALCYGWIDGQKKAYDENSWIQRFTPRRPRSVWSKKNTEHAERLLRAGKIKKAGLAEIEAAKKDGRWKAAYDSPSKATIPEDFLKALKKNKKAEAFFNSLNKTNLYSIAYRLQTAKTPETREKRMKMILEMMAKGEKFH